MNIGEILQNFLDSNEPSITGKEHVLITISESYGTDLFKYDSLKEAREGNERIKTRSAELEDEEDMGIVSLMLKLLNLCMVAVITMSVYVAW